MADKVYQEKEWLREKYIGEDMTQEEMAELANVSQKCISEWLRKTGIRHRYTHPEPKTNHNGYEVVRHSVNGEKKRLLIHRLMATLFVDDICELQGMDVHHVNEIPWDNRFENLELIEHGEHSAHHSTKLDWLEKMAIAEQYNNTDNTMRDIALVWDVDSGTVSRVVNEEVAY